MLSNRSVRKRHFVTLAVGAVAALGTAAVAVSHADDSSQKQAYGSPTAQLSAPVSELDPALIEAFSAFREQRASVPPATVAARVAGPTRYGQNTAYAREIETATGPGWIVPGDDHLCIVVPDPVDGHATSCNPIDDVVRRGIAIELRDGAIPDGMSAQTRLLTDEQVADAVKEGVLDEAPEDGVVADTVAIDDEDAITRGEP